MYYSDGLNWIELPSSETIKMFEELFILLRHIFGIIPTRYSGGSEITFYKRQHVYPDKPVEGFPSRPLSLLKI